MRPPKCLRYLMHRSRLMKMMVSFDVLEKERILDSFFSGNLLKFAEIVKNPSIGSYIRFHVGVDDYNRSEAFREFIEAATNLCKRLDYELMTGWCGNGKTGDCYYSVHPAGLVYEMKNEVCRAFSPHVYNKHLEEYYSKLAR